MCSSLQMLTFFSPKQEMKSKYLKCADLKNHNNEGDCLHTGRVTAACFRSFTMGNFLQLNFVRKKKKKNDDCCCYSDYYYYYGGMLIMIISNDIVDIFSGIFTFVLLG